MVRSSTIFTAPAWTFFPPKFKIFESKVNGLIHKPRFNTYIYIYTHNDNKRQGEKDHILILISKQRKGHKPQYLHQSHANHVRI